MICFNIMWLMASNPHTHYPEHIPIILWIVSRANVKHQQSIQILEFHIVRKICFLQFFLERPQKKLLKEVCILLQRGVSWIATYTQSFNNTSNCGYFGWVEFIKF